MYRYDAPKEMAIPFRFNNGDKIIIELFAVFFTPVIISLVNWNDESLICSLHVGYKFGF
jgi:hypothetical protein